MERADGRAPAPSVVRAVEFFDRALETALIQKRERATTRLFVEIAGDDRRNAGFETREILFDLGTAHRRRAEVTAHDAAVVTDLRSQMHRQNLQLPDRRID